MMVAAASLLIIAYLALGALFQLLLGDLATGLGLTGLVVSPAFGYAGVGFPTIGMNAFAQVWGAILPVRWYMAVLLGQAARGLPLSESARPFAALAALAVIYTLLAFLRLRAIASGMPRSAPPPAPTPSPAAAPRGIGGAFVTVLPRSAEFAAPPHPRTITTAETADKPDLIISFMPPILPLVFLAIRQR